MTNINTTQNKASYDGDDLSQLWLTTSEVAKLTGKTEQSIRKSCDKANGRYRGGVYEFRKPGRNYEILLSSIPNNAQKKYYSQYSLTVTNTISGFEFNAYNAIADAYATKCESIKREAERRLKVLDDLNELLSLKTSKFYAESIIKTRYDDVSKTTLWRWHKLVEGHNRAYWLYLLAPSYEGKQKQAIPQAAWDYYLTLYSTQAKPAATL